MVFKFCTFVFIPQAKFYFEVLPTFHLGFLRLYSSKMSNCLSYPDTCIFRSYPLVFQFFPYRVECMTLLLTGRVARRHTETKSATCLRTRMRRRLVTSQRTGCQTHSSGNIIKPGVYQFGKVGNMLGKDRELLRFQFQSGKLQEPVIVPDAAKLLLQRLWLLQVPHFRLQLRIYFRLCSRYASVIVIATAVWPPF